MCALFVSSHTNVTADTLKNLPPVFVNKTAVRTLAHFLVSQNVWYHGVVAVNEHEIDNLYDGATRIGFPHVVEVAWLHDEGEANNTSSYCARVDVREGERADGFTDTQDLLLESVGYTEGDHSPTNLRLMKASAPAWSLDRKRFVQVRSGRPPIIRETKKMVLTGFCEKIFFVGP
jgi:hypothetical protein